MCEFYHFLVFYIAIQIFNGLRKSFEKLKFYLLISNTDLMQISFTKANHETLIHFNFFPPWPFSLLRSVIFTFSINSITWSDYILLSLKHPERCCWGKHCCVIAFQWFSIRTETSHSFVLTHGSAFSFQNNLSKAFNWWKNKTTSSSLKIK